MGDRRHAHPRFQEGNFDENLGLLPPLAAIAAEKDCSLAEVALAWLLSRGDQVVPPAPCIPVKLLIYQAIFLGVPPTP